MALRRQLTGIHSQVIGILLIGVLLLLHAVSYRLSRDEEQFISGALHNIHYSIYSDFIFLQTPYWADFLSIVFVFIDEYFFLASRLAVWAFSFGSVVVVFFASRSMLRSSRVAFLFAVLFSTSSVLWPAFGTARNDIMACFFAILALALIASMNGAGKGVRWRWFAIGVSIGIAVGTKASYAYLAIVVLLYLIIRAVQARSANRFQDEVIPLILGGGLAGSPILYHAIRAWEQFEWMNITYHVKAAPAWYRTNGLGDALDFLYRLQKFKNFLDQDVVLMLVAFLVLFFFLAIKLDLLRSYWASFLKLRGGLFLALLISSTVFALSISPIHVQYLQPIIPALVFCGLISYAATDGITKLRDFRGPAILALALVAILPRLTSMSKDIYFGWGNGPIVTHINDVSTDIREAMASRGVHGKVATLSPIRVIDGGQSTYREFASGPFFFRTSEHFSPAFIRSMGWVSKARLAEFLDKVRPAAILTGFEDTWPHPPDFLFDDYAKANGFQKVPEQFDGGRLYIRGN